MAYIRDFNKLSIQDVPLVGGKNASLGQMISNLDSKQIPIPQGFAITVDGYWHYLESNNLMEDIENKLKQLDKGHSLTVLEYVSSTIRHAIENAVMPVDLEAELCNYYRELSKKYHMKEVDVAVRSSATAEDLPDASFAGQQDSFLNIVGEKELIKAVKKCMASLFTERALTYRAERGIKHMKVALSVGIQKMVRSDEACSGVSFSLDTETGFKDVVVIDASYGLGETIVQGLVTPDLYAVHKPTMLEGFCSIIQKKRGAKDIKLIYSKQSTKSTRQVKVSKRDQLQFALTDEEIIHLARMVSLIEDYYSQLNKRWTPMDVEWAKDGRDSIIYIVQARPETVHAQALDEGHIITSYILGSGCQEHYKNDLITTGQSIGQKIVTGVAHVIKNASEMDRIKQGEILITEMTDPDWVPVMKRASAIITSRGGRTCHAAIVSRELGIPAVVGAANIMDTVTDGQVLTVDCSHGNVASIYNGAIPFTATKTELKDLPKPPVDIMVNIADPNAAYSISKLPVSGVGLARLEFIIANIIKIHPMALLYPDKIKDARIKKQISQLTVAHEDKRQFFVDTLSQGIGMIAAAFFPRPVIVRLSDFKTNEYRNLIGGVYFEPQEENPMLGLRGAVRYCHPQYEEAFILECQAIHRVCRTMGLCNIKVMVPFVRTVSEAECVRAELEKHGFGVDIIMMCEIPSNVILIDEFSRIFDGFSIGSNDLTQLTLAVDRESSLLSRVFDERDLAAQRMFEMAIKGARRNNKPVGVCGQAPSDFPDLADFFIKNGVTSLSLNADCVVPFLERYKNYKNEG